MSNSFRLSNSLLITRWEKEMVIFHLEEGGTHFLESLAVKLINLFDNKKVDLTNKRICEELKKNKFAASCEEINNTIEDLTKLHIILKVSDLDG